jgi:hydrogenase-4 component B
MGVMTLGLGMCVLGACRELPLLAVVGFAACLLHAANHAVFKALLFLGAGSVMHGTGTLQIDRMGGLLRRMPFTGVTMLIGFAAMAALPPLSGFAGEFLIIGAALSDSASRGALLPGVPVVAVMALVGALSLACAVRVFGIAFLGEPRTPEAADAHESNAMMTSTLMVLAAGCVGMGLLAPVLMFFAMRVAGGTALVTLHAPLAMATAVAACWVLVALTLAGLRALLLRRRSVRRGMTWDCGYAAPSPRMQYTASSFSFPVTNSFAWLLGMTRVSFLPTGLFPVRGGLESRTDDVVLRRGYEPVFRAVEWLAHRCRPLQQGRNQVYVLYIALTVLFLLVWKLRLT